jgi:hypothetical protein
LFIGLSRRGVDGFLERLKSPTRPSRSTSGQTLVMQLDYQCRPEAHARAELRMLILYRRADATRRSSRKLRRGRGSACSVERVANGGWIPAATALGGGDAIGVVRRLRHGMPAHRPICMR